ncbi:MAG: PP0621 family protein [Gammaproteobacteria bacterium]
MPIRTLVILIAVAIIVMVARRLWQKPRAPGKPQIKSGNMVQCASCGVYLPEGEALQQNDRYYCSQAHLEAGDGGNH